MSNQLFETLKQQFPEIDLMEIVENPVEKDSIRVRVVMPTDEDREIDMREMASELSTDILLEYGYHILINSATKMEKKEIY